MQRLYLGNLRAGSHEIVALFTGKGPQGQDYSRGAQLKFEKSVGAKYLELKISDPAAKRQPEFLIRGLGVTRQRCCAMPPSRGWLPRRC